MGDTSTTTQKYGHNLGKMIWFNGKLIPSDSAMIHVTAHSLHYGLGVFEGIRAYALEGGGTGIFRCKEHMQRFLHSCHTTLLECTYTLDQLIDACKETVKASGYQSCYLRPIGFLDSGPLGVFFQQNHPFSVAVMAMDWGKYLGNDAATKGSRLKISSFTRHHPNVSMTKAKVTGQYVNSVYAKLEAKRMGFDEALLLDPEGYVAEGSGENIFVIRKGKVFTPSVESVLEGITRDSVLQIFKDMGLTVEHRRLSRDELYCADEIFVCGTAAEITPVVEIDMRRIGSGKPSELTMEVHRRFFNIVKGVDTNYSSWITRV